jgi:hypothetical protein
MQLAPNAAPIKVNSPIKYFLFLAKKFDLSTIENFTNNLIINPAIRGRSMRAMMRL